MTDKHLPHPSSIDKIKTTGWRKTVEELTGKPVGRDSSVGGVVYLLLDVSPSMKGEKLKDAIQGAIGFGQDAVLKGYAVGIIRFSGRAAIVCKPTRDVEVLPAALNRLMVEDATMLGPPLELAFNELESLLLKRSVVLFTDGQAQDQASAVKVAEALKAARIDVITIGTEDADIGFLRRIATRNDLAVATTTPRIAEAIRGSVGLLSS